MNYESNFTDEFGKRQNLHPNEYIKTYINGFPPSDRSQVANIWHDGYCFGHNEMMEKFQLYMTCQPPPPIVMDKNEVSLSTYKMFVREKIKRDSNGSWWAKLKLWYKFIKS